MGCSVPWGPFGSQSVGMSVWYMRKPEHNQLESCNLNAAVISCSEQTLALHGRAEGGAAVVKASLALANHWGRKDIFFFSLKALSLLRRRKCVGISSLPEQASQFTVTAVGLDILPPLPLLTVVHKHSMEWFSRLELSVCDLCCAVFAGPPLTQSSLINSREQPGTSAVPSLAPVGARLPPPLPQNLLYTVSERKQMPFGFNLFDGKKLHFLCWCTIRNYDLSSSNVYKSKKKSDGSPWVSPSPILEWHGSSALSCSEDEHSGELWVSCPHSNPTVA